MQNLENNMDDLFRKAAANYPLKEGESHWEKIAANLEANATPAKGKDRKKYVLLMMLLLSGLLLCDIQFIHNTDKNKLTQAKHLPEVNSINKSTAGNEQIVKSFESSTFAKQEDNLKIQNNDRSNELTSRVTGNKKTGHGLLQTKNIVKANTPAPGLPDIQKKRIDDTNDIVKDAGPGKEIRILTGTDNRDTTEQEKISDISLNSDLKPAGISSKKKSLYFGIAGGPSFAEVKGQGIRKAGFNAGVIGGYRVNDKISVETGLLFSKRYYDSDGKYFDAGKMPPGMNVINLEGSSSVFEIPLRFNYNLLQRKSSNVYASAGISSHILVNEKNDYLLLVNSQPQKMTANYKNNYGYAAATFDLSFGYEKTIGNHSHVRIEPYLKIPLKGIGVGSMQVMNAGLQLAVTRKAH
jgi:hypothetical protein